MMMKADKRIAILLPCLKFGGAEKVALNLAGALKDLGYLVDIVLMSKEGEFLAVAEKNYNVVDLNCNKTYKLPLKLYRYIRRSRPTVVISNFWKLNVCACLTKMLRPSCRLILWEHCLISRSPNGKNWQFALTATALYPLSDKVVAVSSGVAEDILSLTIGLGNKVKVIFNPVQPPIAIRASNNLARRRRKVVFVGRLSEQKNPWLLLEAFFLLSSRSLDVELLIVGDGPLRPKLESRCAQMDIGSHVTFFGFLEDPYFLMVDCDVLALTSDYEGLPTVIIEALYCGLGVVSTDSSNGVRDILGSDQYGSIVPCNDKYHFADALERELKFPRDRYTQRLAAERFMPQHVVQEFVHIFS